MNEAVASAVRRALDESSARAAIFPRRAVDLPETLCRFRSFGAPFAEGKDKSAVLDLLQGRIQFKRGSTFNDPFEGRPHYVAAYEDESKQRYAMREYFLRLAREHGIASPEELVEARLSRQTMQELVEEIGNKLRSVEHDDVTILCLSHPDRIATVLQWSHYADSHRGVCIELDTSYPPVHFAMKVTYSEEYPTLLVPRTAEPEDAGMNRTFLTKAADWKYEHEFRSLRVLTPDAGISSHLYVPWEGDVAIADSKIVKRLTLGAIMNAAERRELLEWVKIHAPHVEVWQAKLHRSRYAVARERFA